MNYAALLESALQRLTHHLDTDPHQPQVYIQRGMIYFKLGHIAEAIADFDRAEHLNPTLAPYLWQRGLAYYYAKRFADGAKQFEVDLTVNKHDVEETVWRYLCQAQLQSAQVAREGLLPVQNDARPVMAWVYKLFAGECNTETVFARYRDAGRREQFYSHLYIGLYYEAERDEPRARQYITQAAAMQIVDDYMGWVAMVHQQLRGWDKR
jgi:tetratricopeptide (TPR) repeat protein